MVGTAASDEAIGNAEQVSAQELQALIGRVCAAYADELTRSGNALGAEAALISARSRRVALLVTDVSRSSALSPLQRPHRPTGHISP